MFAWDYWIIFYVITLLLSHDAAAAAKSLQSCPTLCDPIDGSPPRLPHPWDSPGKNTGVVAISFSNAWKGKVKVKSLSRVWLFATPWSAAYQAPPSMEFSRQEYWSGVPLPSPLYIFKLLPCFAFYILNVMSSPCLPSMTSQVFVVFVCLLLLFFLFFVDNQIIIHFNQFIIRSFFPSVVRDQGWKIMGLLSLLQGQFFNSVILQATFTNLNTVKMWNQSINKINR